MTRAEANQPVTSAAFALQHDAPSQPCRSPGNEHGFPPDQRELAALPAASGRHVPAHSAGAEGHADGASDEGFGFAGRRQVSLPLLAARFS